jgi:hypothetical protein
MHIIFMRNISVNVCNEYIYYVSLYDKINNIFYVVSKKATSFLSYFFFMNLSKIYFLLENHSLLIL